LSSFFERHAEVPPEYFAWRDLVQARRENEPAMLVASPAALPPPGPGGTCRRGSRADAQPPITFPEDELFDIEEDTRTPPVARRSGWEDVLPHRRMFPND
jgi:hypothetical protein